MYLFTHVAVFLVGKDGHSLDQILEIGIAAGADDIVETLEEYEIYTSVPSMTAVKGQLEAQGIQVVESHIVYKATTIMILPEVALPGVESLIEELEELDDVQQVYTNLTI